MRPMTTRARRGCSRRAPLTMIASPSPSPVPRPAPGPRPRPRGRPPRARRRRDGAQGPRRGCPCGPCAATSPPARARRRPRRAAPRPRRPRASRCRSRGGARLAHGRPRPHRAPGRLPAALHAARRPARGAARPLRAATPRAVPGASLARHGSNVYRRALASWYGPGLYGRHLACGGTPRRRHARRGAQVAAVRHEGHAALPRAHRARPGRRPRPLRRRPRVRPHRRDEGQQLRLRLDRHGPHDPLGVGRAARGERRVARAVVRGAYPAAVRVPDHRPPRPRRVLRVGRAAAPARAARAAGHRRGHRARARSSRRRATRRAASASARRCPPRGRGGCARTRSSSRPTSRPTARCPGR